MVDDFGVMVDYFLQNGGLFRCNVDYFRHNGSGKPLGFPYFGFSCKILIYKMLYIVFVKLVMFFVCVYFDT